MVGPRRLEPRTYGLKEGREDERSHGVEYDHGLSAGSERIAEAAQALLVATAAGDPAAAELAGALAWAVGEELESLNRLVAAVLAGGPFAVRRALELVELFDRRVGVAAFQRERGRTER